MGRRDRPEGLMAEKRFWKRFLETRYFGLVIGLLVFGLMLALTLGTVLVKNIEEKVLDFNFRLKNSFSQTRVQEGVSVVQRNPKISPDILIVGIDDKSLNRFGKWPFPRYRHADLITAFSRIQQESERERALFLDVYFAEPDRAAENDARLVGAITESGRVFMESVLQKDPNTPETAEELFDRQEKVSARLGSVTSIRGDWVKMPAFFGIQSPLVPYGRAAHGYGHPNFLADEDEVYRRQPLVARLSRMVGEIPLDELSVDTPVDRGAFEHLTWTDKDNQVHEVPFPLSTAAITQLKAEMARLAPPKAEDTDNDNKPDRYYYVVRKYREAFLPSITLSLALEYMNKKFSDVEVVLGEYIRIPAPQKYNAEKREWEPYTVTVTAPEYDADGNQTRAATFRSVGDLVIPIDETGSMLVNFMGAPSSANPDGHQTYPIRSFAGYAGSPTSSDPARWPPTKKVANSLLLVGIFAQGLAEDEKPTPFGLMYGVEIHANALNTILMGNFLQYAEEWVIILILFVSIMLTAFMTSRLSTIWSLVATLGIILVYFFADIVIFDFKDYILTLSSPLIGSILCFLAVVAFRTMTEERDKRRIRETFGKYVSPTVVEELLESPPELGGVDKELTVLFSDVRGFTSLSERVSPQELINHLNLYLTAMTDIIFEYTGTLDKYVGDEIMCFWGAPRPQPDHALLACKCALKQMQMLEQLNAGWPPELKLDIGIGLNSGTMTVGNVGSQGRMNYTLMGDNVNLGARLEGVNKAYYDPVKASHFSRIIISENTYEHVKGQVVVRELDNLAVKGKNKPVNIYELIDVVGGMEPLIPIPAEGKGGKR
jgi:adenylate cyclase